MGGHSLPGAQHSKEPEVGKGPPGNPGRQGTPPKDALSGPQPFCSQELSYLRSPRVPWDHWTSGTKVPPTWLLPIPGGSICQQVPLVNHGVTDLHVRKTVSVMISTQALLHSGFHKRLNTPLKWQNDWPNFTDEKLRLPGTVTGDHQEKGILCLTFKWLKWRKKLCCTAQRNKPSGSQQPGCCRELWFHGPRHSIVKLWKRF